MKFSGCTVHFVDSGLDTGPIVAQAAVPVLDTDNADTLAARILVEEHRIYSEAIALGIERSLHHQRPQSRPRTARLLIGAQTTAKKPHGIRAATVRERRLPVSVTAAPRGMRVTRADRHTKHFQVRRFQKLRDGLAAMPFVQQEQRASCDQIHTRRPEIQLHRSLLRARPKLKREHLPAACVRHIKLLSIRRQRNAAGSVMPLPAATTVRRVNPVVQLLKAYTSARPRSAM